MTMVKIQYKNIILVYLLLFVSGSLFYMQSSDKYLVLVFVISVLSWMMLTDRKINDRFILYVSAFAGFLLVISLYTGGGLSIATIIGTTMKMVMAYLILKTVGDEFIETYIKVIVFLAAFSLFGYLTDQLYLFDSLIHKLQQVGDKGFEGILYLYRYHYQGYHRNNSIFYEPGAYQGFLNAGVYLLLYTKTSFSNSRKWTYVALLTVTLFTTFSTTGYLMFAILFSYYLFVNASISIPRKLGIVAASLFVIVVFSTQFHSVIVEKIDSYTSIEDITDSRNRRSFDALVDLEVFKSNIIGVGHQRYYELFGATGVIGVGAGSSNGITRVLAIYGLPFGLFLFGSYYWAIVRFTGFTITSLIPFGLLIMFLVGEAWYVFSPACLAIISAAFVFPGKYESELRGRAGRVIPPKTSGAQK